MIDDVRTISTGSYISQQILICPVQTDLYQEIIYAIRDTVLNRIKNNEEILGLVIDVSALKLIDISNMEALESTIHMAKLLGIEACLSGLRPALAMALVDMGYETKKMDVLLNVEQALAHIHRVIALETSQYDSDDEYEEENNRVENEIVNEATRELDEFIEIKKSENTHDDVK